jgi:hypothetical protein
MRDFCNASSCSYADGADGAAAGPQDDVNEKLQRALFS